MTGTVVSAFLYNGSNSKDRPADLGYFIGSRFAEACYARTADKAAAVRDILRFSNPEVFLRQSGSDGGRMP